MKHYMKVLLIVVASIVPLIDATPERVTDKVTFEVSIGGKNIGKIEIGLFGERAPRTVENFVAFAGSGVKGLTYEGSIFYRVVKGMIHGDDVLNNDGTGKISKFGGPFEDELPSLKHSVAGLVSTVNAPYANSNDSRFFITTIATPWIDKSVDAVFGQPIVFGKVLDAKSMEVLERIQNTPVQQFTTESQPRDTIKITGSSVRHLSPMEIFSVDVGAQ